MTAKILLILTCLICSEAQAGKFDGLHIAAKKFSLDVRPKFQKLVLEVEKRELVIEKPKSPVILFTATWCGSCKTVTGQKKWAEDSGWKFGPNAHIEIVDIDENPTLFSELNGGNNSIPLMVTREGRRSNPATMLDVLNFYKENQ